QTSWTNTGGYLATMSGADGQMFGLGLDGQIWRYRPQAAGVNPALGYTPSKTYGFDFVVGSVGDANSANDIVFLLSYDSKGNKNALWQWTQTTSSFTGGYLKRIFAGDNQVFGVGFDGQIWRYRVSGTGAGWLASGVPTVDIAVANTGDGNPL